jgi:AraC family transcriptional regulator
MLAFHPPMEVHTEHLDAEEVWSFNIEFTASWARGLAEGKLPLDQPFDSNAGPAPGLAVRILDEFEHFDASSPLIVEGLMLQLLGVCDRGLRGESVAPRWLLNVKRLLRERCAESWSLTDVAAQVAVHPGYLAGAFRRHFGCTVGEFVRSQRIAGACDALANGNAPLSEIALAAGFADQSHFTRTFKRQLGLTPAAYRKAMSRPDRSKS